MKVKLFKTNDYWSVFIPDNTDLFCKKDLDIEQDWRYILAHSMDIYHLNFINTNKFKINEWVYGSIVKEHNKNYFKLRDFSEEKLLNNNIKFFKTEIAIKAIMGNKKQLPIKFDQAKYIVDLAKEENIVFNIKNGYAILQKYLLFFKWDKKNGKWTYPQLKIYNKSIN